MSTGTAFALAAIYVLLGAALAYALFRVIAPRDLQVTATSTGRRWCAWTVAAATVTMFPRVLHRAFDVDAIALWLIGAVAWGAVAFLVGWTWRAVSGRSDTGARQETIETPQPLAGATDRPSQSMPTRRQDSDQTSFAQSDDEVYEQIAAELESGQIHKGLWTRLFAECGGDETRTKVAYIRERAARLFAEKSKTPTQSSEAPPAQTIPSSASVEPALCIAPDAALIDAVWNGSWNTAAALLAEGKRATGFDKDGHTLLDLATIRKDKLMLDLLRRYIPNSSSAAR